MGSGTRRRTRVSRGQVLEAVNSDGILPRDGALPLDIAEKFRLSDGQDGTRPTWFPVSGPPFSSCTSSDSECLTPAKENAAFPNPGQPSTPESRILRDISAVLSPSRYSISYPLLLQVAKTELIKELHVIVATAIAAAARGNAPSAPETAKSADVVNEAGQAGAHVPGSNGDATGQTPPEDLLQKTMAKIEEAVNRRLAVLNKQPEATHRRSPSNHTPRKKRAEAARKEAAMSPGCAPSEGASCGGDAESAAKSSATVGRSETTPLKAETVRHKVRHKSHKHSRTFSVDMDLFLFEKGLELDPTFDGAAGVEGFNAQGGSLLASEAASKQAPAHGAQPSDAPSQGDVIAITAEATVGATGTHQKQASPGSSGSGTLGLTTGTPSALMVSSETQTDPWSDAGGAVMSAAAGEAEQRHQHPPPPARSHSYSARDAQGKKVGAHHRAGWIFGGRGGGAANGAMSDHGTGLLRTSSQESSGPDLSGCEGGSDADGNAGDAARSRAARGIPMPRAPPGGARRLADAGASDGGRESKALSQSSSSSKGHWPKGLFGLRSHSTTRERSGVDAGGQRRSPSPEEDGGPLVLAMRSHSYQNDGVLSPQLKRALEAKRRQTNASALARDGAAGLDGAVDPHSAHSGADSRPRHPMLMCTTSMDGMQELEQGNAATWPGRLGADSDPSSLENSAVGGGNRGGRVPLGVMEQIQAEMGALRAQLAGVLMENRELVETLDVIAQVFESVRLPVLLKLAESKERQLSFLAFKTLAAIARNDPNRQGELLAAGVFKLLLGHIEAHVVAEADTARLVSIAKGVSALVEHPECQVRFLRGSSLKRLVEVTGACPPGGVLLELLGAIGKLCRVAPLHTPLERSGAILQLMRRGGAEQPETRLQVGPGWRTGGGQQRVATSGQARGDVIAARSSMCLH
eukprot:jgi/Mesvir1/21184/Mv26569-RA.2